MPPSIIAAEPGNGRGILTVSTTLKSATWVRHSGAARTINDSFALRELSALAMGGRPRPCADRGALDTTELTRSSSNARNQV
jgi:hypothetical protein